MKIAEEIKAERKAKHESLVNHFGSYDIPGGELWFHGIDALIDAIKTKKGS